MTKKTRIVPWREFLAGNRNRYAFAGNRFRSTNAAQRLFLALERAGATDVGVSNVYDEPWRIQKEGGPYADTLHFCAGSDKRAALAVVAHKQPDEFSEESPGCFRAWWD